MYSLTSKVHEGRALPHTGIELAARTPSELNGCSVNAPLDKVPHHCLIYEFMK